MFDTEKFICEIEIRPALYNVKCKDYSNREVKAKEWNEVGKAMFDDWESPELSSKEKDDRVKDLFKRWKTLRDSFIKDNRAVMATGTGKAASSKKRYVFYEQLKFILPYIKGNSNTGSNNVPPTCTAEEDSNIELDQDDMTASPNNDSTNVDNQASGSNESNKRKRENPNVIAGKRVALEMSVAKSAKELTNILSENLQMKREERSSDKYGNRAFLLSLLPVLDSIPLQQSMLLRGQISEVFTKYYSNQRVPSRNLSSTLSSPQTPLSVVTEASEVSEEFNISDNITL